MDNKFNSKNLEKLNNTNRLKDIPPLYIWETLKLKGCSVILDIGAGTGLFSRAFSDLMKDGTVYAADISETMVNWMKNNLSQNYKEIIPINMTENMIDLGNQSVELILMISLFHELKDPEKLLNESFRLLKTNGKLCIIDWKKEKSELGPPLEIRCLLKDIEKYLKNSNFSDIKSDTSLKHHNIVWAIKK